jgi:hypothetical protein
MAARIPYALAAICILAVCAGPERCFAQKEGKGMTAENTDRLLMLARDPGKDLRARLDALKALGETRDKALAPRLRELWNRRRPTEPKAINWDPEAAERVVDLHLILALVQLGDGSLVSQIANLVAKSGEVLEGPNNEPVNAAHVLRGIGALSPVQQVVQLADNPALAPNVVRTLQLLNLPAPPTGGPVTAFPQLGETVNFVISRFSEELNAISQLGKGLVVLSPGVQSLAKTGDYDRGPVVRSGTTLAVIITQELDALGVTYAVTRQGVVICTFAEAGKRWQQQWPELAQRLAGHGWYR